MIQNVDIWQMQVRKKLHNIFADYFYATNRPKNRELFNCEEQNLIECSSPRRENQIECSSFWSWLSDLQYSSRDLSTALFRPNNQLSSIRIAKLSQEWFKLAWTETKTYDNGNSRDCCKNHRASENLLNLDWFCGLPSKCILNGLFAGYLCINN